MITNGGGTGVITADAIGSSEILKMAEYSNQTKKVLRKAMPPLVNITNPLDLAGTPTPRGTATPSTRSAATPTST